MQYAERLPIGLQKVIRTVSPETVKHFYEKWYHLSNMAVIAVGDFSDTQVLLLLNLFSVLSSYWDSECIFLPRFLNTFHSLFQVVVELIKTHFGQKIPAPDPPCIPRFPVVSHDEPRFSCFIESEAAGVSK